MALALAAIGCSDDAPPPPQTHAVSGKVYDAQGQPLRGGILQFISQENPNLTMSAIIGEDGSYALTTMHGNRNLAGAIAGDCQVLVTLPFAAGQIPQTITLPELVHIDPQPSTVDVRLDSPPGAG